MSQGNVYLCQWKKVGRKFTVALKSDESVAVSAANIDAAEAEMWDLLLETFGDGAGVVEFDTPPPRKKTEFEKRHGDPHLVVVSGNFGFGALVNSAVIHPKGYCPDCHTPFETVKEVAPEFDLLPAGDGGIVQSMGSFFSEDFLALLTPSERDGLGLKPVIGPKGSRKKFFHVTGEPAVHCVGVPGFEGFLMERCRHCKRPLNICYLRNCEMYRFIALSDLPKPLPTMFLLGWPGDVSLCMTRRRYAQIVGKRGTRNISSSRIWVVPDDGFVREIDVHTHPLEKRWVSGRFFPDLK